MSGSQALEVNADTQTKQGALSARAGLRSKWALIGGFCVAFTAAYLGLLCIASFFAAGAPPLVNLEGPCSMMYSTAP